MVHPFFNPYSMQDMYASYEEVGVWTIAGHLTQSVCVVDDDAWLMGQAAKLKLSRTFWGVDEAADPAKW